MLKFTGKFVDESYAYFVQSIVYQKAAGTINVSEYLRLGTGHDPHTTHTSYKIEQLYVHHLVF